MSTNEDLRRSKRTTAGVPPNRYRGDVSPVDRMPPENESSPTNAPSQVESHHSSWRGSRSVRASSTVSTKRRKEAEAVRKEKLNVIKEEYSRFKKQVQSIEVRLRAKQRTVELLRNKIQSGVPSGSNLVDRLEEAESEVQNLQTDFELANLDLQEFEENRDTKIDAINSRFDADADVDSDEGSMNLSDGENHEAAIKNWVNESRANAVTDSFGNVDDGAYANADVNLPPSNVVNQQQTSTPAASQSVTQDSFQTQQQELMLELIKSQLENSKLNQSRFKSHADRRLPAFNGDPAKWNIFLDAYERSTKKYDYDEAENVRRLQESLFGDAERAVNHLLASPRNVPEIMKVLKTRFGRPVLVIDHCIREVKRCADLDLRNLQTIDNFGVKLNSLVANICSFDRKEFLTDRTLLKELVNKLPTPWAHEWYKKQVNADDDVPNIQDFRDWINVEVEAVRLREMEKKEKPVQQEENWRRRQPGRLNNINGADKDPAKPNRRPLCPCCQKSGHELAACFKFQKETVDSRWEIARQAKVCFSCLKREKHTIRSCPLRKPCGISGCQIKHHELLHADTIKEENQPEPTDEHGHVGFIKGCDGPLPIIPVKLEGPKGVKQVYTLLDTGATRSLILSDVADFIGLNGKKIDYKYSGICGVTIEEKDARHVSCEVSGTHKYAPYFPLDNAVTVSNIPIPPYTFELDKVKQQWPHLRCVPGSNLIEVVPSLVIGNNNPLLILANRIVSGPKRAPVGWRTKLGWTVSGSFDKRQEEGRFNFTYLRGEDERQNDLIKLSQGNSVQRRRYGQTSQMSCAIYQHPARVHRMMETPATVVRLMETPVIVVQM